MCSEIVLLTLIACCATFVSGQQSHYVNIAPGKSYSQISYHGGQGSPSNAANGNTSGEYTADNCIHTREYYGGIDPPDTYHWWQVDLGRVYPVYSIAVWERVYYNTRLYPFIITVDGQLCVNVTSDPGTRSHSVTCANIMYGRVVRLTLQRRNETLNLCELQIFVCESGYFGADCSSPCDTGCEGGCYMDTGNCTNCKDGFWGPQKCQQSCSSYCSTAVCQRANGHCTGCQTGYHGSTCNKSCSSLASRCTQCTQDGTCTACSGHFVPPTCTVCDQGYYKNIGLCQLCSSNCRDPQCDRDTGRCNGCRDGWYGGFCATPCSSGCGRCHQDTGSCEACATNSNLLFPNCTECEDGYYKQSPSNCIRCPGTCDNNSPCDKTTGRCEECPPGTQGDFCQQDCASGQYGPSRCSLRCGQCQDGAQCHPVTGHCHSCHPGYHPPLCQETCTDNTYGQNCSESCGHCKGGQPCDPETGHCTTGCQPGYTGQLCDTECEAGRYGTECSQPCGYCQVNTTCQHQDGRCPAGCVQGLLEPLCLQVQEKQVAEGNLDASVVAGSVIGAAVILSIAVIAAVCWYRRSTRQPAENRATTVPMKGDTAPATATAPNSPVHRPPTVVEYYEIADTANAFEMQESENNYNKLHPYNNSDADREPYATMTSSVSDVKQSSSDTANVYVNSAMGCKLDSL